MEFINVSSTTLAAVGYDESAALLAVRFISGREYHYFGVPRDVYDGFFTATSIGHYFNNYVKRAGYPFQQVG